MHSIDTSSSLRIAVLMEMLDDVSRATDSDSAFRAYARRIRRVRPVDALVRLSTINLGPGHYRLVRAMRLDSQAAQHPELSLQPEDWSTAPVHSTGFLSTIVNHREPVLLHDLNLDSDPVLGSLLRGMNSCTGAPMFEGGRITGWSVLFNADPQGYTIADLEDALLIANLMGSMVRNLAAVQQISALNTQLRNQFDEVARVQHALLPSALPTVPGLTFAVSYLTSGQYGGAGGDSYEFFDLGSGSVGVLIADVSGHGPAAATVMAMLHATLHARPDVCASPSGALKFANARLASSSIEGSHITAAFSVIDSRAGNIVFARAGHPIPRLRTSRGHVLPLGTPADAAAPMGILADPYDPPERTLILSPGDSIILYTDGLTEAVNSAGEQFGMIRLDRAIATAPDNPQAIINHIQQVLTAHTAGAPRADDQTLVVVRAEG